MLTEAANLCEDAGCACGGDPEPLFAAVDWIANARAEHWKKRWDFAQDQLDDLASDVASLNVRIWRARELHSHYQAHGADGCDLCRQPWPCQTVAALGDDDDPTTMWLCETEKVMLRPDMIYRFEVKEDCERCVELAQPYRESK